MEMKPLMPRVLGSFLAIALMAGLSGCSRQSVTDFTPYPGETTGIASEAEHLHDSPDGEEELDEDHHHD